MNKNTHDKNDSLNDLDRTVLKFQGWITGQKIIILFSLMLAVYLLMANYSKPLVVSSVPTMQSFEQSSSGYSVQDVRYFLEAIEAKGRADYLGIQIPLDFLYAVFFALAYTHVLLWLFGQSFRRGSRIFRLSFVPLVIGTLNCLENTAVIKMINSYPDISDNLVEMASSISVAKYYFNLLFFALLIISALFWVKNRRVEKVSAVDR